ncbi:lipoate--protein ligase family protein [Halobiforma nitratireducens]|uniref:Biotin/lipoate A/B protein ligase n=1 Tax=Halobiforma nitratireducens JCM 10879 TaxID=1227454 RepID=M0MB62_9EURY|nr:lipoate--protein ligase family protein [Halobiforma nitratireducens]EMA41884.1 biotin/lipoate A/B protein ligase [Halobiforma nitratireducens JCM 10879]
MRVFRGRGSTIERDRAASARLLEVATTGEPAVRVWRPHRQLAFGRRDCRRDGYDRARAAAREADFPPVERDVGGRAVAYDGETTIAFARAEPIEDFRRGTDERYDRLTADLERGLAALSGLDPGTLARDEPANAFCPGSHSLSTGDGGGDGALAKIAGIAQRVRQDAAVTAGILVVAGREPIAGVLEDVYGALEVAFDPGSVGSLAAAGGPADAETVRATLEDALVGEAEPVVEPVQRLETGTTDGPGP